jgi:hypothetical protein
MMPFTETKIRREDWDVGPRLAGLWTSREKLLRVRSVAIAAAADATPFHPSNAAGTFSYQHGTFSLRDEHVGENEWAVSRPSGVEAIENRALRARFVFANVDIACNDDQQPKARSEKGAGAERLCAQNRLFDLPYFVDTSVINRGGWTTYYLMVAPNGASELSLAIIENKRFTQFIERLYLSDGSDLDLQPKRLTNEGPTDQFDPQIARR